VSDGDDRFEAPARAVAAFWDLFTRTAADVARAPSPDGAPVRRLLEALHAIDRGLFLEVAGVPGASELIVTAEGKAWRFALARAVAAAAPRVNGWSIRALRPKRGFPASTRWGRVTLRTTEIVFDPLERPGTPALGLRILVPGIDEVDIDDAHAAILCALDHGLGEEQLATEVAHTEVRPLPADVSAGDYIPLTELEMFIQWRQNKRK
jgi:hypothetical protein